MHMRLLRRWFAAVTICATFLCGADAPARATSIPGPLSDLQVQLALMSMRAPGHTAVMVKDLTTGLSTGFNQTANMPAASTIKIPVMVEVFKQMATGTFDLNRKVTLEQSDRDWGWGDLASAPGGARYTVSRLLWLMITESDNTATNMLIRLVGRAHINRTMANLGLHQTQVADYIRSDGDIRSLRTSPFDMAKLLEAMARDRLVDEWSSREMIAILTGQHHNGLLPEPLPPGTQVAHKTGTLHDTLNDVGIVYLNTEPYIIAVMTTNLPTLDAGRQFIRGVSRIAYASLEKFANWRAANDLERISNAEVAPAQPPDVKMWEPAATIDPDAAPSPPVTPPVPGPLASPPPAP